MAYRPTHIHEDCARRTWTRNKQQQSKVGYFISSSQHADFGISTASYTHSLYLMFRAQVWLENAGRTDRWRDIGRRDSARSLTANRARRPTFAANHVWSEVRARAPVDGRPRAAETQFAATDTRGRLSVPAGLGIITHGPSRRNNQHVCLASWAAASWRT